jgi:hypothetical protein
VARQFAKKAFFRVCTAPHRFGARLAFGGREQMLLLSQPSSRILENAKNKKPALFQLFSHFRRFGKTSAAFGKKDSSS